MGERLGEKLYATRVVELLQLLKHLWSVKLQLLDTHAREREGHLEGLAVLLNHLANGIERGHVATLGYVRDGSLVLIVVIIIVVCTYVKEAVPLQM